MSDARTHILARLRHANRHMQQPGSTDAIKTRLQQHSRGPQPRWQDDLLEWFVQKLKQAAASCETVNTKEEIAAAVSTYMSGHSLGQALVTASTPLLTQLGWPAGLSAEARLSTTHDRVVLVEAFAGIAETGSIVMLSGRDTPVSLNFLPDHFLCVLRKSSIVNNMEDAWEKIRRDMPSMPRSVNIITGPSRTADVEQIIQMGAHGPRKVHLLLLD